MTAGLTEQFGRLPYGVVEAGGLAGLSRNELAAYAVIVAHAGGDDWSAHPSIDRIAKLGGMSTRTVTRVVGRLAEKGLIRITLGGGRGRANTYAVIRNPDSLSVTLSPDGNPDKSVPEPCQSDARTPTSASQYPDSKVAPQQNNRENTATDSGPAATADAGAHAHEDVKEAIANTDLAAVAEAKERETDRQNAIVNALVEAEVSEPTRSELADTRGISPEMIRQVADETRKVGGGTGALVLNLRTTLEAQALREEQAAQRRVMLVQKQRAEQQARDKDAAARAAERAKVDALPDDEFNRLAVIGRKDEPEWLTKIIAESALEPRKNRLVRAAVLKALDQESHNPQQAGSSAAERTQSRTTRSGGGPQVAEPQQAAARSIDSGGLPQIVDSR